MVLSNIMTVHAGPRTWSSYTNVNHHNNHQANRLSGMNSVQELNNYHRGQQYSAKTAATTYDFPENPNSGQNTVRKEKKWSFGSLFRRKKRDGSDSSSDGDSKNFLTRRRRKKSTEKKKRNLVSGNFDHIVPNPAQTGRYYSQSNGQDDVGVLSDPSGGFSPSYSSRPLPKLPQTQQQLDSLQTTNSSFSVGSSESSKRSRRDRHRLRPTRNNIDCSSDDDSQSSARLKSDESLVRSREGSTSRKSRSARTERYIRRLSKDEENILNREAALIAAARSSDKTGIATIPAINRHSNSHTSLETPVVSTRQINYFSNRSISYEANIHRSPINLPSKRIKNLSLGNPYIEAARYPPTPPPRDPKRIPQEPRPISTYYNTTTNYPQNSSHLNRLVWNQNNRSNSEDHIAIAECNQHQPLQVPRPNSAQQQSNFQYLAEKKPRSRRPIVIQSNEKINQAKNDEVKQIFTAQTHVRTNIFLPSCLNSDISSSPNCMMGVDTVDCSQPKEVYIPRQVKNNIYNNVNSDRSNSPFKPICSPNYGKDILLTSSVDSLADEIAPNGQRRKSTNLEEALDELEAIYKSLHLGDEDLLERAEQREMSAATKKLIDSKAESYPGFVYGNKENIFSYEPFDTVDVVNKNRLKRRSQTIDRKYDDMAFRKMTRERSSTIADPSSVISYLLTSPVHGSSPQELVQDETRPTKEPDITLDDVVFRTIRHANDSLKVVDPQPPFGIPIGPISIAPNSDYLHAVPDETMPRYSVHRRRIPDIVKDDLAYRNLRKELNNKEPIFKSLVPEDVENNNADLNIIKKKRAVRSLSANITNLLQRDAEQQQQQEIDDVADAMEIARQILREKEVKINSTNRAFMSDTDTKYRKDSASENRLNFLNTMKSKYTYRMEDKHKTKKKLGDDFLESKPPKSTTPERRAVKESTPVPHSPSPMLTRQDSLHSSLEELLTAFAVEARETSDRITNELMKLDEDVTKKLSSKDLSVPKKCYSGNIVAKEDDFAIEGSPKFHKKCNNNNKVTFSEDTKDRPPVALPRKSPNKESSPRGTRRNIGNEKSRLIDEIDKVAIVTARIVNTPTKELIVYKQEIEADNLVDDQLLTINAVADHAKQCEQLAEAIIDCATAELIEDSVPESVTVINQDVSQKEEKSVSPEHDYVNISDTSDVDLPMIDEIIKDGPRAICKSPFQEHKAELIASFQELDKLIDEACLKTDEAISTSKEDIREISPNEGETEAEVGLENIQYKAEEQLNISHKGLVTSYKTHYTMFVPNYDSVGQPENDVGELASLESLKSPKLVFSTLGLSNLALDEPEIDNGSQFTSLESEVHINNTVVDKIPNNVSNGLSVLQALKEANVSSTCQNKPLQFIDNFDLDESELLVNETFDKKRNKDGLSEKFVDNLDVDDTIEEKHPLKFEPLQKRAAANDNSSQSSTSKPCTDNKRNNFHHDGNSTLKERPWYCDPMLLVIVCYYGLACSYQLATMDAVTILGLVFVIVSVIAAMIL